MGRYLKREVTNEIMVMTVMTKNEPKSMFFTFWATISNSADLTICTHCGPSLPLRNDEFHGFDLV